MNLCVQSSLQRLDEGVKKLNRCDPENSCGEREILEFTLVKTKVMRMQLNGFYSSSKHKNIRGPASCSQICCFLTMMLFLTSSRVLYPCAHQIKSRFSNL